ncbi:mechanosensitive ion channel family protein [Candidatus Gracilibacteria bacterium]|nr:mechanosensitive ion channel family protein [Candidatus Gracilibacteria bacterium]
MRRFLLAILCFSTLFGTIFAQDSIVVSKDDTVDSSGFFATGNSIKKLESKKIELNSFIKTEKERVLDEQKQKTTLTKLIADIETLVGEVSVLHNGNIETPEFLKKQTVLIEKITQLTQILSVSEGGLTPSSSLDAVQRQFSIMKKLASSKILGYDAAIAEAEKNRSNVLSIKQKELSNTTSEIERLYRVKNNQLLEIFRRISYYLAIFIGLYLVKIISKKILYRVERDFSKSHQQAIHMVHKWIFGILFVATFLVLFLAEFVSLLPFLAIIGTAIGLALRDVIYSFIAWFAVGSNSGYQEGEIIEIDSTIGKVYSITPLLTTISEIGQQGVTCKMISFPNKTIFEKNIKNWSRGDGFVMITFEFILSHESDVVRARELLMEVIGEKDLGIYYHERREIARLKSTFGYSDNDIRPQINVSNDPRGIILRAKVLVHFDKRVSEQSRISEEFSIRVQQEKNIEMRQI